MEIEQIEIRPAILDDIADISSLSRQLGYQSSAAQVKKRLEKILTSNEHCVFVACQLDGKISGWIHVFSTLRVESDPFSEIGGLVVDELQRNQGIGAKLVCAAQEWTAQKGFAVLKVRSRRERKDAKEFYLKMEFSLFKAQNVFEKMVK